MQHLFRLEFEITHVHATQARKESLPTADEGTPVANSLSKEKPDSLDDGPQAAPAIEAPSAGPKTPNTASAQDPGPTSKSTPPVTGHTQAEQSADRKTASGNASRKHASEKDRAGSQPTSATRDQPTNRPVIIKPEPMNVEDNAPATNVANARKPVAVPVSQAASVAVPPTAKSTSEKRALDAVSNDAHKSAEPAKVAVDADSRARSSSLAESTEAVSAASPLRCATVACTLV